MGCQCSHQEIMSQTFQQLPESKHQGDQKIYKLAKGGVIVNTSQGLIQYGIPPESVKDSMVKGDFVPQYYIIPENQFDFTNGVSLMEIEFPVYYNFFFKRQKTTMICDEQTKNDILTIFQETLLGPKDYSQFKNDFIMGYKAMPDMKKETTHFAVNPFNPQQKISIEQFIEFLVFNKNDEVLICQDKENQKNSKDVKIKKNDQGYVFFEDNEFYAMINKEFNIEKRNYHIYKNLLQTQDYKFEPPLFGITAIGASHGFDQHDSTSGFVIWINQKGIFIDPPPFSSNALKKEGIPPSYIEKIILTHCHADHDAGTFHKIVESSPVEFITTKTIMDSFLRKYSAQTKILPEELKNLFHFREVKIGHSYKIFGAKFNFNYSFHSIPCLTFNVSFHGKKFYLSGDTFYNPEKLEEIYKKGIFSKERFQQLSQIDFSQYDLIFHEAGIPPIHTPKTVLQNLPEEIKKKMYLYHIALHDVPNGDSGLNRVQLGLENTYRLLDKLPQQQPMDSIMENLELLSQIDIIKWIPFKRITEVIQCVKEKSWKAGEFLIQEGDSGQDFYIVKKGTIEIYSNNMINKFRKLVYKEDYFGESAIVGNHKRLANVRAITDCICLVINANDFKWIFEIERQLQTINVSPLNLIENLQKIRENREAELINQNSVIKKMNESQKCMINMLIEKRKIGSNEFLWKKGEKVGFCFLILSGKFKMTAPSSKIKGNFCLKIGSFVGDFSSIINSEKCNSSVQCIEEGEIFIMTKKKLINFLCCYPAFYLLIKSQFVIHQQIFTIIFFVKFIFFQNIKYKPMQQSFLSRLKFHRAHSHTSDHIESFDRLEEKHHSDHHPKLSEEEIEFNKKEKILSSLRNELVDITQKPQEYQNYLCYRKCFEFDSKSFIQECLTMKCQTNDFNYAAKQLNYLKQFYSF